MGVRKSKTGERQKRLRLTLDWFYHPFNLAFAAVGLLLVFWWMVSDPTDPKFLGVGDAWVENGPKLFYVDHAIHNAEIPLWNPLTFSGHPAAANPQYFVFYPPNLIRSLLTFNPTPYRTHVGIAIMVYLHLVFAAFTTFLFARSHGLSGGAAMVAAFAFIFSMPMVSRAIGHWQFVVMVSWIPLNLYLLRKAMIVPGWRSALRYFAGLGLVFGVTLLGGSPHFMMLTGVTLGVYWLAHRLLLLDVFPAKHETLNHTESRSAEVEVAGKSKKLKSGRQPIDAASVQTTGMGLSKADRAIVHLASRLFRDAALGAMALLIGLMVASPMLLSAVELSAMSDRGDDAKPVVEIFGDPQADWSVFRRLAVYSGTGSYESLRGAGAGVLILALASLLSIYSRRVILFLIVFFALLDCSLEDPYLIGKWLIEYSPYSLSSPARAMLVGCLPLGILAGIGLDSMLSGSDSVLIRAIRCVGVLVFSWLVLRAVYDSINPHPWLDVSGPALLCPLAIALVVIAGAWLREPITWGAIIAMLLMGDALLWNSYYLPAEMTPRILYPRPFETLYGPRRMWSDNRRGTDPEPNLLMYDLKPAINGHDPLHIARVRDVLASPFEGDEFRRPISPEEVTALNYRGNLFLKRPFWLVRQYVRGDLPPMNVAFPPTTTVFLPDPPEGLHVSEILRSELPKRAVSDNLEELPVLKSDDPPVLLTPATAGPTSRNNIGWSTQKPFPKLHSSLVITFTSDSRVELRPVFVEKGTGATEFGRFADTIPVTQVRLRYEVPTPDFAEMEFGIVPIFRTPGNVILHEVTHVADKDDEDARIRVLSRTANTVEVELTDLPDYRMLVFIDSYYPGWRGFVDGERVPILLANDAFKAVEVPPGTHRVRFEFRPWRPYVGIAGAVAAALVAGLILIGPRLRRLMGRMRAMSAAGK